MKPVSRQSGNVGAGTHSARSVGLRWRWAIVLPALILGLGTRCARAQATPQSSQALAATPSEESEAANRKALEGQAGKNGAKLMLRSVPDKSSVRMDGKPVGKTPLLLIVAPGVYLVEMEGGPRMSYGRRQVDLLPKEARDLVLDLQPRYPASRNLSWDSH